MRFLEPFETSYRQQSVLRSRKLIQVDNLLIIASVILLSSLDAFAHFAPWSNRVFVVSLAGMLSVNLVALVLIRSRFFMTHYAKAFTLGVTLQHVLFAGASTALSDQTWLILFPAVLLLIIAIRGHGMTFATLAFTQVCAVSVWAYAILSRGVYLSLTGKPYAVLAYLVICLGVSMSMALQAERASRREFATKLQVDAEKARSENLLAQLMPPRISERIQSGESTIADYHEDASVLFADLKGFTELASRLTPREVVAILDDLFSRFDDLMQTFGMEKVKTLGDGYMAVSGLTKGGNHHPTCAVDCGLAMIDAVQEFNNWSREALKIRVGIATGPVVAGIVGKNRYSYDVWGDTVNVASRIESQGVPNRVQVSQETKRRLEATHVVTSGGMKTYKGKGNLETWLVEGRREALKASA